MYRYTLLATGPSLTAATMPIIGIVVTHRTFEGTGISEVDHVETSEPAETFTAKPQEIRLRGKEDAGDTRTETNHAKDTW